jgi:hypothetical protein
MVCKPASYRQPRISETAAYLPALAQFSGLASTLFFNAETARTRPCERGIPRSPSGTDRTVPGGLWTPTTSVARAASARQAFWLQRWARKAASRPRTAIRDRGSTRGKSLPLELSSAGCVLVACPAGCDCLPACAGAAHPPTCRHRSWTRALGSASPMSTLSRGRDVSVDGQILHVLPIRYESCACPSLKCQGNDHHAPQNPRSQSIVASPTLAGPALG